MSLKPQLRMQTCACVRNVWLAYASLCLRTQIMGFLWPLCSKNIFFLIKSYIFHFNSSQVNFTSALALNQPWSLEFGHHWGTGARVVRSTKCVVYTYSKIMLKQSASQPRSLIMFFHLKSLFQTKPDQVTLVKEVQVNNRQGR